MFMTFLFPYNMSIDFNLSSILFLFFTCLIDIIVYLVPRYSGVSTEEDIGSLLEMFSDIAGSHDDSDGRRTSHDWDRTSWRKLETNILSIVTEALKRQFFKKPEAYPDLRDWFWKVLQHPNLTSGRSFIPKTLWFKWAQIRRDSFRNNVKCLRSNVVQTNNRKYRCSKQFFFVQKLLSDYPLSNSFFNTSIKCYLFAELLCQVEWASTDRILEFCAIRNVSAFFVPTRASNRAPKAARIVGDQGYEIFGLDRLSGSFGHRTAVKARPSVRVQLTGNVDTSKAYKRKKFEIGSLSGIWILCFSNIMHNDHVTIWLMCSIWPKSKTQTIRIYLSRILGLLA